MSQGGQLRQSGRIDSTMADRYVMDSVKSSRVVYDILQVL